MGNVFWTSKVKPSLNLHDEGIYCLNKVINYKVLT